MEFDPIDMQNDINKGSLSYPYKRVLCFSLLLIALVIYMVLFNAPRLGVADNGDFFRIGSRMGLIADTNWVMQIEHGEPNRFFTKIYEDWSWDAIDWTELTPETASFSAIYPLNVIRLITNILWDTSYCPLSTVYLAVVYSLMLLLAFYWILKFSLSYFRSAYPVFLTLVILVLLGSMNLSWFNSLYGESMIFVSLLLCIGSTLECISAEQGSMKGRMFTLVVSVCVYLLSMAKPQCVISFPFWAIGLIILICYHWRGAAWHTGAQRILSCAVLAVHCLLMVWTGHCCLQFYDWNTQNVEKDTLYSSVMTGLLPIVDDRVETCKELGIDPILVEDMGKNAYWPSDDLVTAPRTPEAEERLYSKTNTFGLLGYYIRHPKYLYTAMDITAEYARQSPTDMLVPLGAIRDQDYKDFGRLTLWENIRPSIVPAHFYQYIIVYIVLFAYCIFYLTRKNKSGKDKLLIMLFLLIMLTGIMGYPLTFIGNGLADCTKQLYLFMTCYDITLLVIAAMLLPKLARWSWGIITHKK